MSLLMSLLSVLATSPVLAAPPALPPPLPSEYIMRLSSNLLSKEGSPGTYTFELVGFGTQEDGGANNGRLLGGGAEAGEPILGQPRGNVWAT